MVAYTKEEVIDYLSQNLNVPKENLSPNTKIYTLAEDSLNLFDLELSLESKFSNQDINLREKTITVGDLIALVSC